jgi:hypothetical protein
MKRGTALASKYQTELLKEPFSAFIGVAFHPGRTGGGDQS